VTDAAAGEPREFRPSWPVFHRRMLRRLVWLAPLFVLVVLIAAGPSLSLAIMALGAALVLAGVGFAVYFARTRAMVADGELRIRGPLRTRRWHVQAIGTLVFVPLPGTRQPTLYGVSPVLERMFSLSPEVWEEHVLEELAEAIGAPVVRAPAGLPAAELAARYPGTVGWTTTRPWLVLLLLMGGTVLLMMIVGIIMTAVLVATGQVPLPTPSSS
jgi:hypothetical protein